MSNKPDARSVVLWYFAVCGLIAHLVFAAVLWYAHDRLDLQPADLVHKLKDRISEHYPAVAVAIVGGEAPRYLDHHFDGRLRATHPRILLPDLRDWSGHGPPALFADRDRQFRALGIDAPPACGGDLLGQTACWISSGDPGAGENLLNAARRFTLVSPRASGEYGNGWELAFAYDFLRFYPGLTDDDRASLERGIEKALIETLSLLDDPSPSLWHGRSTLAAIAWLCAVVLDPVSDQRIELQRRAQGHFLDVMRAWKMVEAWPEGYNYWVQSRAFLLVLAASAYVTALEDARHAAQILETLRRAGYWHVYITRPDNLAEGFGDEGSRVDLKDETQRVIDLIVQLTRDPVLAAYSRYLEELHGSDGYYRDYRWGYRLFRDPALLLPVTRNGLQVFEGSLPRAELFGHGAMNMAYIRSGWGDDATFISFRAGHVLTHHGHYDAGHFSLYKGRPLAVNSSTYGPFTGSNRLYYSIRSIAKNTLLVLRPGERVVPNRLFEHNVADGGQRVVLPTGSGIRSVDHWMDNLDRGLHLRAGVIEHHELQEGDYVYLRADLTDAYNTPRHDEGGRGGKVSRVVRELVYLFAADRLLVHDRVSAVEPHYIKKWLLHSVHRPDVPGLRVLKGEDDNGILESLADIARITNGSGHLVVQRLLPADAVMRIVGGPEYQYYVETDADERVMDGFNFRQGAANERWFDVASWRLEIQPEAATRRDDRFLVALSPGLGRARNERLHLLHDADSIVGVYDRERETIVAFVDGSAAGGAGFRVEQGAWAIRLFGFPGGKLVELYNRDEVLVCQASQAGACRFALTDGPEREITVNWR